MYSASSRLKFNEFVAHIATYFLIRLRKLSVWPLPNETRLRVTERTMAMFASSNTVYEWQLS